MIYKHLVYNPFLKNIQTVIQEAQDEDNLNSGLEWCFMRSQPITQFEWVAIFEKETEEYGEYPKYATCGNQPTQILKEE